MRYYSITIQAAGGDILLNGAPAVARDDSFAVAENALLNGNVLTNVNPNGADSDPENDPFAVTEVNDSVAAVGNQIVLASGALLTVNANGTFTYNPNDVFDALPGPNSNASNLTAPDTFTYTVTGDDKATVTITVRGVDGAADELEGTAGRDYLRGGVGDDTMRGGAGNDVYYVDSTNDLVIELANQGTDTVSSSATFTLGNNVENLLLAGSGNIDATGNALRNVIAGNAEINVLTGGAGNDSYVVQNTGDQVVEQANEGTDSVSSTATFTLGDNVEKLVLKGSAAIDGTGNALRNRLTGNSGLNVLTGGAHHDIYDVQNTGDQVVEQADGGIDLVFSSASFTLADNVEQLALTGNGNIDGTGNALRNRLTGNGGLNVLTGGAGGDAYVVQNTGDRVVELANGGTDVVYSSANFSLSANVEMLVLTTTGDIDGTGNGLANTITGNAGDNVLDGGRGNDKLNGGAGDDTYIIDSFRDVLTEFSGVDLVRATISHSLSPGIENLTLLGDLPIHGRGNTAANVITGNDSDNNLFGEEGADILIGGAGDDQLNGGGGFDGSAEGDRMVGGAGDDAYWFDHANDQVVEEAGAGIDQLIATVTVTLPDHVENGTVAIDGKIRITGNELDNRLSSGSGPAGSELAGGKGNDTYVIENSSAIERPGEGIDTVIIEVASPPTGLPPISRTWCSRMVGTMASGTS